MNTLLHGDLGILARENVMRLGQLTIVHQGPYFIFTGTRPTVSKRSGNFKLDQVWWDGAGGANTQESILVFK